MPARGGEVLTASGGLAGSALAALPLTAVERVGQPWVLGTILVMVGLVLLASELAGARARRRVGRGRPVRRVGRTLGGGHRRWSGHTAPH